MVLARQTSLTRILGASQQLRVPMYQRRYAWGKLEWNALWDDIAQLALDRAKTTDETHFLGSVVLAQAPVGGSQSLLVVDGQQRLITVTMLLCAIRDADVKLPVAIRRRIDRCLLLPADGRRLGPLRRLKVLPTELDQDAFSRLVHGQEPDPKHPATQAYGHFASRLKRPAKDADGNVEGVSVGGIRRGGPAWS